MEDRRKQLTDNLKIPDIFTLQESAFVLWFGGDIIFNKSTPMSNIKKRFELHLTQKNDKFFRVRKLQVERAGKNFVTTATKRLGIQTEKFPYLLRAPIVGPWQVFNDANFSSTLIAIESDVIFAFPEDQLGLVSSAVYNLTRNHGTFPQIEDIQIEILKNPCDTEKLAFYGIERARQYGLRFLVPHARTRAAQALKAEQINKFFKEFNKLKKKSEQISV